MILTCLKCGLDKDESDFYSDRTRKSGKHPYCKGCFNAGRKVYYEANKPEILARQKEYTSRNREAKRAKDRQYRARNIDRVKEVQKEYRTKNKDKILADRRRRWREDPRFKLSVALRNRINFVLSGRRKTKSSLELLGCSYEEARKYIETRFQEGMTWENHGLWHIDHKKPLLGADVDLDDPNRVSELCHYTNLQPLWGAENIRKSNRMVQ